MNCIVSFFPAIKLAVIAFIVIYLLSLLNLVPVWKVYRGWAIPLLLTLTIAGVGFLLFKNIDNCVLIGGGVFILTLVISFFLFFLSSNPIMSGKELVKQIQDSKSGDNIFIYEHSEMPDGFIKNIVTVQSSWLPIEKNILEISSSFSDASERDGKLFLFFKSDESIQYTYSNGAFQLVTVKQELR